MRKSFLLFVGSILVSIGIVSPAAAQLLLERQPNAFGLTDGVIGCDLTADGLVVNFVQSLPGTFNGDPMPGDFCLPFLAGFPGPFPTNSANFPPPIPMPRGFAQLNRSGDDQTVLIGADHMVWVVYDPQGPEAVIGCALDAYGLLETVLIAGGEGYGELGAPCYETVADFERTKKVAGPVAATLGDSGEGRTGGGLLWYAHGINHAEVIACDVDPDDGSFNVTFHETSDGVIDDSVGQSCLGIIAEDVEGESLAVVTLPLPVPRAGTHTSDPGCLIWDVDSGIVLESGD